MSLTSLSPLWRSPASEVMRSSFTNVSKPSPWTSSAGRHSVPIMDFRATRRIRCWPGPIPSLTSKSTRFSCSQVSVHILAIMVVMSGVINLPWMHVFIFEVGIFSGAFLTRTTANRHINKGNCCAQLDILTMSQRQYVHVL